MTRPGSLRDVEDPIFIYEPAISASPAPALIACTAKVSPALTVCLALPAAQGIEL